MVLAKACKAIILLAVSEPTGNEFLICLLLDLALMTLNSNWSRRFRK